MMSDTLPAEARLAWQAYQRMSASKHRHLEYLQHLERKYQRYGAPSNDERARLQTLLEQHDARVNTFKGLVNRLKIEHPSAFGMLVMRLAADASSGPSGS
jgi:hypothetical protein